MTATINCSRCGTPLEGQADVGTDKCGWCECDIRNQRRREQEKAQPGSLHPVVGCDVCRTDHQADDVTHLRIYVAGSEGVNVCLQCRQVLTEVLRGMMRAEHAGMKRGYLACKKVQEAKASNEKLTP